MAALGLEATRTRAFTADFGLPVGRTCRAVEALGTRKRCCAAFLFLA
jgi:hypothetical protein